MTRIKICGITNIDDALRAAELGAHAVGLIFADSPRRVTAEIARNISMALPPFISTVGVFVHEQPEIIEDRIKYCRLDAVQLAASDNGHDDFRFSAAVIRAFRVENKDIIFAIQQSAAAYFLMDTYDGTRDGGSGHTFDWSIAREATKLGRVILAGGLNPDNIAEALGAVHPYAVDVSSGVEASPGVKDSKKMRLFIKEVQRWDSRTN